MAELLRTNLTAPPVAMDTKQVTSSAGKTSRAFGQLAELGAKGVQLYEKEHEAKMARQAMNDLVNDAVNPDLEIHQAAYARVVTHARAMNSYNDLKNGVEAGQYNELEPEEFQKTLRDTHSQSKEAMAKSKFSDHIATSYDKFWLENESTLVAGQAGMYRKNLEFKQGRNLLEEMTAVSKETFETPEAAAKRIIETGMHPDYSMVDENAIIDIAMQAGIASNKFKILEALNDELHFAVDPKRSNAYNSALKQMHQNARMLTEKQGFELLKEFQGKTDNGTLMLEEALKYTKVNGPNGRPIVTYNAAVNAVIKSEKNRLANARMAALTMKTISGGDISNEKPETQQKVFKQLRMQADGQNMDQPTIDATAGKIATGMSIQIDEYKQLVSHIGQFDLETMSDPEIAKQFVNTYNRSRIFFGSMGPNNPKKSAYTGEYTHRFDKMEEYLQYVGGTGDEAITTAAKMVASYETASADEIPAPKTEEWDTSSAADTYVDSKQEGFKDWAYDVFVGDRPEEEIQKQMFDTITKMLGADFDMPQGKAEERAAEMMDRSSSYFGGKLQSNGIEDVKQRLSGDPQRMFENFLKNPAEMSKKENAGISTSINPKDWLMTLSEDMNTVQITEKANQENTKQYATDQFMLIANFDVQHPGQLVNLDYIWGDQSSKGKQWKNKAIDEKDAWAMTHVFQTPLWQTYATEYVPGIKNRHAIPAMQDWVRMSQKQQVAYHQSWRQVNYAGQMHWGNKLWEATKGAAGNIVSALRQAEDVPKDESLLRHPAEVAASLGEDFVQATNKGLELIGKVMHPKVPYTPLIEKDGVLVPKSEAPTTSTGAAPSDKVYHGTQAIAKVTKLEGKLTTEQKRVVEEEGYVEAEYPDDKGVMTQGVGQTGEFKGKTFKEVFKIKEDEVKRHVKGYTKLPVKLRAELVQLHYRGDMLTKSGNKTSWIKHFNNKQYAKAGTELLNHAEYKRRKKAGSDGVTKRLEEASAVFKKAGNKGK